MWIVAIIGLVMVIVAGVLVFTGRRTQRKVNILKQAIPTSAADIVQSFPGELVTVRGTATGDRKLVSEQGQVPCVYYSYTVEREFERTERHTTGTGNNERTETRTVRSTETVASHSDWVPFSIEDESGSVHIEPDGAEWDARQVVNRYEPYSGGDNQISIGGFSINLSGNNRTLGHRFKEYVVPAGEPVFVMGCVDEAGQIAKPNAGRTNAGFVISHRNDKSLRESWEASARWQVYSAIGLGIVGTLMTLVGLVGALL